MEKATYVSRQLFFEIFVYMFGISWIEYMGEKTTQVTAVPNFDRSRGFTSTTHRFNILAFGLYAEVLGIASWRYT